MWWKTTEVNRVPLPYAKINALNDLPIEITSKIGIFTHSDERSALLVDELNALTADNDLFKLRFESISVDSDIVAHAATPAILEMKILQSYRLDDGDFVFLEWHKFTEDILVTSERSAMISNQTSALQIHRLLMQWILREPKLRLAVEASSPQNMDTGKRTIRGDAPPNSRYDLLFSVFNPRPDLQTVNWNVQAAIEAYIRPFARKVDQLSDFVLKSQWKYEVPFEYANKQIPSAENASGYHYSLAEDNLPHIITSIEGKLGASIFENPTIHIVVYVPSCDTSPLHIYNKKGERASTSGVDSFLSSKWGGIIIANPSRDECLSWTKSQQKAEINVNTHSVMHVALFLLRRIVDLHVDIPTSLANVVPWESVEPRAWEIDSYLRIGAVQLISSATSTLQSLVQLLDGISNIVINDDVGLAVNEAYRNIVVAKQKLRNNELSKAVEHAKKAFEASEKAFFDPSLLALLYFPGDQKYAIYIPLFLPVLLPIILSVDSIFKHFRNRKKIPHHKAE